MKLRVFDIGCFFYSLGFYGIITLHAYNVCIYILIGSLFDLADIEFYLESDRAVASSIVA